MSQHEAVTPHGSVRHLVGHLVVPLYLALGMALAYLGAFHQATPHHLPVAVVGQDAPTAVLATRVADTAGDALTVRTVPATSTARAMVEAGDLAAAYVPGTSTVVVASAASPSVAEAARTVFDRVAAAGGQRLTVDDVEPLPATDAQGNNLFFLLVALSVGGYTAAATLGVAGAAARVRFRDRTLLGVGLAGVIAGIGTVVAGPVLGAVHGHLAALFGVAWLYVAGVVVLGSSLHAFVGRWATPVLVTLFVMLNFTTSGGVFDPRLQGGVFAALSQFWDGAAFLRAARTTVYGLPGGVGADLGVLVGWLALGVVAVVLAARVTAARAERGRPAAPLTPVREDEELEENVAA